MHIEDAERLIIKWIREKPTAEYPNYGYDVYLSNVIRWHLRESGERDQQAMDRSLPNVWPTFVAAAWELCRRGVIRPGVRQLRTQSTEQGSAGEGYSITPFGAQWAAESDSDDFVPTESQRFAQMLAPYVQRFGPGFHERAQEAVRCYGAHAYPRVAPCVGHPPSRFFSLQPSPSAAMTKSSRPMRRQPVAAEFRPISSRTLLGRWVRSSATCLSSSAIGEMRRPTVSPQE